MLATENETPLATPTDHGAEPPTPVAVASGRRGCCTKTSTDKKPKKSKSTLDELRERLELFPDDSDVKIVSIFQHFARTFSTNIHKQDAVLCGLLKTGHITPEEAAAILQTRGENDVALARDAGLARLVRDPRPEVRDEAFRLLKANVLKSSDIGADHKDNGKNIVRSMLRTGKPPSDTQIRNLIDKISIWTTLLLGFTQGNYRMVPTSVLSAADLRWEEWCDNETIFAELGPEGWCDEPPSHTLFNRAMLSFIILAATLFFIIGAYISMNWAELSDVDKEARARWWHQFRWLIYLSLVGWLAGVFSLLWTNAVAVRVIYDDEDYILENKTDSVWRAVANYQWVAVGAFVASVVIHALLSQGWNVWLLRRNVENETKAAYVINQLSGANLTDDVDVDDDDNDDENGTSKTTGKTKRNPTAADDGNNNESNNIELVVRRPNKEL